MSQEKVLNKIANLQSLSQIKYYDDIIRNTAKSCEYTPELGCEFTTCIKALAAREQEIKDRLQENKNRLQEIKDRIVCVFCEEICDCEFGNNPYPVSETGRCCNECNRAVIAARFMFDDVVLSTDYIINESVMAFGLKHGVKRITDLGCRDKSYATKLQLQIDDLNKIEACIYTASEQIGLGMMRVLEMKLKSKNKHLVAESLKTLKAEYRKSYQESIAECTELYANDLNSIFGKIKILEVAYLAKASEKTFKIAENIKNEVEVKVVKKDTKKEQTRNANKAQADKKAEKAAYEKQCMAAAIIKAAQEQKKKAKKIQTSRLSSTPAK